MNLERTEKFIGAPVAAKTAGGGTKGLLTVARCRHGDAECEITPDDTAMVVVNLSDGQHVERHTRGIWTKATCAVGSVTVADPQENTVFAIKGEAHVLLLFLPFAMLADQAEGSAVRVAAKFEQRDIEIARCAMRAVVALQDGEDAEDLLFASIAQRLARCIIETRDGGHNVPRHGGIGPAALKRSLALIDARLHARFPKAPTLAELADAASVSLFHFARGFRELVGETPHAYVLRRRLELARAVLAHGQAPIAEVGRRAGFQSTAHFVERFRREMGVTPGAFRDAVGPHKRKAQDCDSRSAR
jgi:AraC family transcriptional regulator